MVLLYLIVFHYFSSMVDYFMGWVPGWLFFLNWLFYLGFTFFSGTVIFYGFSVGVNIIAAPFNGLLAEKVEEEITGEISREPFSLKSAIKLILNSLVRELQKLGYFLPRFLLLLLISIIPVLNVISPFLWLLFGAWMLSIQYMDYAFDNNKIPFGEMRATLRQQPLLCLTFGFIVMLLLPIPLVNLIVMPLAVVAATILWLKSFKEYYSFANE